MDATVNVSASRAKQLSFLFALPPGPATLTCEVSVKPQLQRPESAKAKPSIDPQRRSRPDHKRGAFKGQRTPAPRRHRRSASSKKLPATQSRARLAEGSTMQNLLDLAASDPALKEWKRRNLASSIRKFVEYLGVDLHLLANFPTYRGHLKRFHLGNARISKHR